MSTKALSNDTKLWRYFMKLLSGDGEILDFLLELAEVINQRVGCFDAVVFDGVRIPEPTRAYYLVDNSGEFGLFHLDGFDATGFFVQKEVQLDNIIYVAIKRGDIIINTSFYRHLVP
jgi:hypothetical protein